jgi:hypothetical protein
MTILQPDRLVIENPAGSGWVYKGKQLLAKVTYELQVTQNVLNNNVPVVTGKIRRMDTANILWSTELLTLHLEDRRKLDFLCVNFDPECNIASDNGFYI